MEQSGEFDTDAFFNDGSIQQIDPNTDLRGLQNVSLSNHPATIERLLNLQRSGCSQRISWSKLGLIASISDDGVSIEIRSLYFKQPSRLWVLKRLQTLPGTFQNAQSVLWSPNGGDLAIIDSNGRTSLFQVQSVAVNRLVEVRPASLDEPDELGEIIGLRWLSQDRQDRPKHIVLHTAKAETKWVHEYSSASPLLPLWQRAIVMVDRKGTFSLLYQRLDSKYDKVSIKLPINADAIYTHASFAATVEGKLIVALHAVDSSIAICYIQIDFTDVRQNPEGKAVLTTESVKTSVFSYTTTDLVNGEVFDPDLWLLTHLDIIPTADAEKLTRLPPTLLAIYLYKDKGAIITDPGHFLSSNIRRWAIHSAEQKLHPRFDELPSKASEKHESAHTISLQRQLDRDEQVIISAEVLENGQTIALTTQDGRIDVLNADDLTSQSFGANCPGVKSMAQAGFRFPVSNPPVYTSFSPNLCGYVSIDTEGKIDFIKMEYPKEQDTSMRYMDPNLETAFAALILGFSRACWSGANFDDIICMAQHTFLDDEFPRIIFRLYRTLFRDSEFVTSSASPSDLEKVVQKPILGKVLSFHAGLTFMSHGDSKWVKRSLSSTWVWMANNFRFVATLIYGSFKEMTSPVANVTQELVDIVCNNIRWSLDVIRYMATVILEIGDRDTNPEFFVNTEDMGLGDEESNGSQGLVALLLNCHWSRTFLSVTVRALRMYTKFDHTGFKHQDQIIRTIHQYSTAKGLNLAAVEGMVDARWATGGDQGAELSTIAAKQIEMMSDGLVPASYAGIIERLILVFNSRGGLRDKGLIDRLKLFTDRVDLNWVLLNRGKKGSKSKHGSNTVYDVLKKKVITEGVLETNGTGQPMIRRCVRCGSYNNDVNGMPREPNRLINPMLLRCVCDGQWVIEPWNDEEEI